MKGYKTDMETVQEYNTMIKGSGWKICEETYIKFMPTDVYRAIQRLNYVYNFIEEEYTPRSLYLTYAQDSLKYPLAVALVKEYNNLMECQISGDHTHPADIEEYKSFMFRNNKALLKAIKVLDYYQDYDGYYPKWMLYR